jgi:hypothetical protein
MSRVELGPERGRAVAARLRALGVKGILIKAAELGYITQSRKQDAPRLLPDNVASRRVLEKCGSA